MPAAITSEHGFVYHSSVCFAGCLSARLAVFYIRRAAVPAWIPARRYCSYLDSNFGEAGAIAEYICAHGFGGVGDKDAGHLIAGKSPMANCFCCKAQAFDARVIERIVANAIAGKGKTGDFGACEGISTDSVNRATK